MAKKEKELRAKLEKWKERLAKSLSAYSDKLAEFDSRERLYLGRKEISKIVEGDKTKNTAQVRNVVAELIESEVDSSIPMPKVTAVHKEDEGLARKIENMLRNEVDRLPMERLNDMAERTVPLQGGAFWLVEWDNADRTHSTIGDVAVSFIHPKKVVPQDGVYDVKDMDYFFVRTSVTKKYIKRRYGITVFNETESNPELKTLDGESHQSDELVTLNTAYYKNENGGIGLFSWCNETVLADFDDYQRRKTKRCKKCGALMPADPHPLANQVSPDGTKPEDETERKHDNSCPYCGSRSFEQLDKEEEEIFEDKPIIIDSMNQRLIPKGAKIPYYVPDMFPVVLHKNVSVYGQLLGDSDADKVADQQNSLNRISQKINEKLIKSGSYMSLPEDAKIKIDSEELKTIRLRNPADKAMIDVYNMEAPISQDLAWYSEIYEEARQALGITNSFQGRYDAASESGVAKRLAIAQSAGRLESKRIMKNAAFADLYELIFKYKLAYADEPRPIVNIDYKGETEYEEFDRYEFVKQDESGAYYWEDRFLFDVDTSSALANNREAMWQELRQNFSAGCFGNPTEPDTLIMFWEKMEEMHYPGAGSIKKYIENKMKEQQAQQMAMQMMMAQNQGAPGEPGAGPLPLSGDAPAEPVGPAEGAPVPPEGAEAGV